MGAYAWRETRIGAVAPSAPALRVGLVLVPGFSMLSFGCFVETLRLASENADVRCTCKVMTSNGQDIPSNNGILVTPTSGLREPEEFDYVVVIGGDLRGQASEGRDLVRFLKRADAEGIPLVGVCTGSFVLARAGLLTGRRACVSWYHSEEFTAEFGDIDVCIDRLFVVDDCRITCAGGLGALQLASHLVELSCGGGTADKGMRMMMETTPRDPNAQQPGPGLSFSRATMDARVHRAVLLMERDLGQNLRVSDLADKVGVSVRQLNRLFLQNTGRSPAAYQLELRLHNARDCVIGTTYPITDIAYRCGFSDASHLARYYRRRYGVSPTQSRQSALGPPRQIELVCPS